MAGNTYATYVRVVHRYLVVRLLPPVLALTLLLSGALITADASGFVVKDTFNIDTANTPLPEHSLETDIVGGGWIQSVGADFRITLDGLAAHETGLDTAPGIAVIDTLSSEFDLEVTIGRGESASVTGLVFRYIDENNYLAAVHDGKHARLIRVSAGDETVLDNHKFKPFKDGTSLWTARVRYGNVSVEIDGKERLETDDASFTGATHAGLIYESVQATSFRDFSVESDKGPPGIEPVPEPVAPTVFDTFSASDGTALGSHTGTEVKQGTGWEELRGAWEIVSGKTTLSTPDPASPFVDQMAVIQANGSTDQELSVDITWSGGTAGVVWNVSDASNYSLAFWEGESVIVGLVAAGGFRELGRQKAVWSPAQQRNLRVQVTGNRARLYLDDSEPLLLVFGLPEPSFGNGGVFVRNGADNLFDNFIVRDSQALPHPDPIPVEDVPSPPVSTETPKDAWVFDSFDSPDFTLLQHRTPDLDPAGQGWLAESGFWQVWQAQASEQSGVFGPEILDRFAVIDTGVDQYRIEAWIEWDGGRVGVFFGGRATGPEDAGRNGYIFFRNGDWLEAGRLIGGVYFRIDRTDDFNWKAGKRKTMRVEVEDGEAKLKLSGKEVFKFSDPALNFSTWAGIFQRGLNDERFNDFTVRLPEGVEPPPLPSESGLGPVEDIEMIVGETLELSIPVTGPAGFAPDLTVSALKLPDGTIISDSFDEGAVGSVPLVVHSPKISPADSKWIQVRSGEPAVINGGTLNIPVAADGGDQRLVIETGYVDVQVDSRVTAIAGRFGLVARHDGSADDQNWVMGWADAEAGLVFVARAMDGEFRLLRHTPFSWQVGETREMRLSVTGEVATLSIDDEVALSALIDGPMTGTHAGMFAREIGENGLFDEFSASGIGLPGFIVVGESGPGSPSLLISPRKSDAGRYKVTINSIPEGAASGTSFNLNVKQATGPFASAGGPYVSAEGDPVFLDASGSTAGDAGIASHEWDIDGDGQTDLVGPTVEFTPTRTGTFEVALTVSDVNGLESNTGATVTVVPVQPAVDLTDLIRVGASSLSDGALVLTPDMLWQAGAAWTPVPVAVSSGFTATFTVEMATVTPPGADGFAFVIQASPAGSGAIGSAGDGLGYSLIENSLAIEFDTWTNTAFVETGPHVAVHGISAGPNSSSDATRISSVDIPALASATVVHGRVEYHTGVLKIYFEDFSEPLIEVVADLAALLDLSGGSAFVGFTASTGGASASHTVTSFHLGI